MSLGDLFIPFNHQPTSTSQGSGTFTCGAGKYARVTISVSGIADAFFSIEGVNPNGTLIINNGSFVNSLYVWITESDTISFSVSNASGSTTVLSGGSVFGSGSTTVSVLKNGSAIASFYCSCSAIVYNSSGASKLITYVGSSSAYWHAEEYNVLT